MAESNIESSFLRWCKKVKYWTLKLRPDPEGKGWPDRAVLLPGNRVCWIEFKTPTGEISPHQKEVAKNMLEQGHDVYFCRSSSDGQQAVAAVLCECEGEAIQQVLRYGEKYGYGNLIEKLQDAWARSVSPGLSENAANVMAGIVCSNCNTNVREY